MNKFKVCSTNAAKCGYVRIYNERGDKIGEVEINAYGPINYLRAHPGSRYHDKLYSQVSDQMTRAEYDQLIR